MRQLIKHNARISKEFGKSIEISADGIQTVSIPVDAPILCRLMDVSATAPDENKIYFHKREDKSDRDSFFLLSELIGLDLELVEPSPKIVTLEEIREQVRHMQDLMHAGENCLFADNI